MGDNVQAASMASTAPAAATAPVSSPNAVDEKVPLAEQVKLAYMERDYVSKAMQMAATIKFTGDYFVLWQTRMQNILTSAHVWSVVHQPATAGPNIVDNGTDIINMDNAKMIILCGLSNEIASQYTTVATPHELWVTLNSVYNANTATTRAELRKTFQSLTLQQEQSVSAYVERLKSIVSRMESLGVLVSNEEKVEQLYSGLPPEFEPTIMSLRINNQTDFNAIVSTIRDYATGKRNDNKHKMKSNTGSNRNKPTNSSNSINKGGFPFRCYRCNQDGHKANECSKPKPTLPPCIYCKKNNHKSEVCRFKPQNIPPNLAQLVTEAVQATLKQYNFTSGPYQAHAVTEQVAKVPHTTEQKWTAMLDSAASRHLIKDASLIDNMHILPSPVPVVVANNEVVNLEHGGQVTLTTLLSWM